MHDDNHLSRAQAFERSDDTPSNPSTEPTLGDIINARFKRRDVLKGALGVTAIAGLMAASPLAMLAASRCAKAAAQGRYDFEEISHGVDETHHVAPGYDADILIRWGDPVLPGAPAFDPRNQTADAQAQQFGYNNDYLGFVPLDGSPDHGLLCVNHEYTNEELMFPGLGRQDRDGFPGMTRELVEIEMAAHGGSVIEIKRENGQWRVVKDSRYARRITPRSTEMTFSGPAAGHERMKTKADPSGMKVVGTVNNCAGGITPWGTYLMAEENFHGYFSGEALPEDHPEAANHKRYGVPGGWYAWGKYFDRWNIDKEPNEPNRWGWIVEVDPMDPDSVPVKHTAMGRAKHEGAESIVNQDGRVVVYSGDDQRFDYLYKFVSRGRYDPADRAANQRLLSEGTLYVAKFNDDGSLQWLALEHGQNGLSEENGFKSQADVLIETRRAADLLGATPLDRPEDVEANPTTNKVYVMLTNNSKRQSDQLDRVNPRPKNIWGQIVELTPPEGDHASTTAQWELLVRCGDPNDEPTAAQWNPATSDNGWFSCPDNCAVDHQGRLWITTDQGSSWKEASGTADGVWALETEGELRGTGKLFFRVPVGAEMCGPVFTPNDETLFVAVQHVAADGTKDYEPFGRDSTFDDPATRWPDFDQVMPPRPSVVAITKQGGGKIG